jgi:hypothetical protein
MSTCLDVVQDLVDGTPNLALLHHDAPARSIIRVERSDEPLAHHNRQVRVRGALSVSDAAGDADERDGELLARARGRSLER